MFLTYKVRVIWSSHPVGHYQVHDLASGAQPWHSRWSGCYYYYRKVVHKPSSASPERSPVETSPTGNESGGICRTSSAIALFKNVQKNIQTDKSWQERKVEKTLLRARGHSLGGSLLLQGRASPSTLRGLPPRAVKNLAAVEN